MTRSSSEHFNCVWPGGSAGLEAWSSRWSAEPTLPHAHDEWQVSLTRSGSGTVRRRGTTEICRAGSLVVLAPGELHTLVPAEPAGTPWVFDTLFVSPERSSSSDSASPSPSSIETPRTGSMEGAGAAARFTALHRRIVRGAESLDRETALCEFLAMLQRLIPHRGSAPLHPVPHSSLQRVREYLEAHPGRAVTLAELAALAGIGEFHLVRLFRREFGLPPYAYHLQVRINRARGLLRRGLPVAEAAFETGFADQAHLTRHFRKLVGLTPGNYRAGWLSKTRSIPSA